MMITFNGLRQPTNSIHTSQIKTSNNPVHTRFGHKPNTQQTNLKFNVDEYPVRDFVGEKPYAIRQRISATNANKPAGHVFLNPASSTPENSSRSIASKTLAFLVGITNHTEEQGRRLLGKASKTARQKAFEHLAISSDASTKQQYADLGFQRITDETPESIRSASKAIANRKAKNAPGSVPEGTIQTKRSPEEFLMWKAL